MKLVEVERDGKAAAGVMEGKLVRLAGGWHDGPADRAPFALSSLMPDQIATMAAGGEVVPRSSVSFAVPVDPIRKITCVGVNYRDHAGEIKSDVAVNPIVPARALDSLVPDGQPIAWSKVSETFGFESEFAVMIGKPGVRNAVGNALGHVLGFTYSMNGSVREQQRHALTTGKNFWRSGTVGPWVVTADKVGDTDMMFGTLLNDDVVQSTQASMMVFGIAEVISCLSSRLGCSRAT